MALLFSIYVRGVRVIVWCELYTQKDTVIMKVLT